MAMFRDGNMAFKERLRVFRAREAMVCLGLFAGLRYGEVRGLDVEHIDFHNNMLDIRKQCDRFDGIRPPKWNSVRRIEMFPPVRDICWLILEERGWPTSGALLDGGEWGERISANTEYYFDPVMARAGLVDENGDKLFTFHCLRHFYGSIRLMRGDPVPLIARDMGHKNLQTFLTRYAHVIEEMRRQPSVMHAASLELVGPRRLGSGTTVKSQQVLEIADSRYTDPLCIDKASKP